MNREQLAAAAESLLAGRLSITDFVDQLGTIADVGEAQVDLDRRRRCGFPEVVYGPGKTVGALEKIFHALLASGAPVLATRISPEQAAALEPMFPAGRYHPLARTFRISLASAGDAPRPDQGHVAVVTAGTSDLPVAEEARETALWTGARVTLVQ
ncbi:MAG TPA: 1-(5-phosphoribosyl)-5-amino-4-imidazole-carboxylate carboxylase, partial [Pirellulales bacterium]